MGNLPAAQLDALGRLVAARLGLDFPAERASDLCEGVRRAAHDLGYPDVGTYIHALLSNTLSKEDFDRLANHLTVGETYFLRDPTTLSVLETRVLPQLIAARAIHDRRLNIWVAACCTGEEAYSVAICIDRLIPDRLDWRISIRASDINTRFLRTAARGVYGSWSFRDTPIDFRQLYFTASGPAQWALIPAIRDMVRFDRCNLVEHVPSGDATMDVILCRNVLMYFSAAQAERVVRTLAGCLAPGGWLVVAPIESSLISVQGLEPVRFDGATLFRNAGADSGRASPPTPSWVPSVMHHVLDKPATLPAVWPRAPSSTDRRPADTTAEDRSAKLVRALGSEVESLAATARAHADLGQLAEALHCCDRLVSIDKMAPGHHYLRACIFQEQGALDAAVAALQRVLYLDPDFVLAHLALGHIARRRGQGNVARRHYRNTVSAARGYPPDAILPESEGLTVDRLLATMAKMLDVSVAQ